MLAQFKTLDDSLFLIDTVGAKWARISAPPIEGKEESSVILESGGLTTQGFGVFTLAGRTQKTEGPGAGLCTVGIMPVVAGTQLTIYLDANVPIFEFTMPAPIQSVQYQVLRKYEKPAPPVEPEAVAEEPVVAEAQESQHDFLVLDGIASDVESQELITPEFVQKHNAIVDEAIHAPLA